MQKFPTKPKNKCLVYLDNAAATCLDPEVKKAMEPYFLEIFGNPSGLYGIGREANTAIAQARKSIAKILKTTADTIIFTSGGTESDNLAIFGVAYRHKNRVKSRPSRDHAVSGHIVTTKIEHHAVLHPMEQLEKEGFKVTYLDVNEKGQIDTKQFKKALRKETILVSIIYANNEVGVVEPIADIGRIILKWRASAGSPRRELGPNAAQAHPYPYFHTDACQAAGALELDVEKLHVDLMTVNGSKIYGPKGAGLLYKRRNVQISPIILGGAQEMNLRAGTENVAGIVGLAKALKLVQDNKEKENKRLIKLRNYFWEQIQKEIPKVKLNGPAIGPDRSGRELGGETARLPNNLNVSFLDIEGEALLLYLDEYGIICSTGSACTSETLDPSHVLLACGLPHEYAHGSIRFSLGKKTTKKDIDYVMKYLPPIVKKLREISPVDL